MMSFDAVIRAVAGLQAEELHRWIEEQWVLPQAGAEGYFFQEVDIARVRLIYELRYELAIDEEAMPVVLQLLDQVYALRRRLRVLCDAIERQPAEVRQALLAGLDPKED